MQGVTARTPHHGGSALSFLNQSSSQENHVKTYASSLSTRPKKTNAIVVESIEGYSNDDYLDGLEKLVSTSNVTFISKISGGRVCIYLNSEQLVAELSDKKIQVKNSVLSIRPFVEKNKRVVISNVNPSIPHDIVISALKNQGIVPVSGIHDIKASLSKPGRSHILSFRRQVYIKEQDEHQNHLK